MGKFEKKDLLGRHGESQAWGPDVAPEAQPPLRIGEPVLVLQPQHTLGAHKIY